jgi:SAM-dependent methyltransferase
MDPTQRFSDRVDDYVRYRPSYPAELIPLLEERAGLTTSSVVADVGSGTGISTALFVEYGCTVFAVEPNGPMREAAERALGQHANFRSVGGTAEETNLPGSSVDLVVAAQAFHWFDRVRARHEFDRILRPGGKIALVWNNRELDTTPFLRAYEALLLRYGTDYLAVRRENITLAELVHFFGTPPEVHRFPYVQLLDRHSLRGRLLSSSYTPGKGHPNHEPMLHTLDRIFEEHQENGIVRFEYATQVFIGYEKGK